MTHQRKPDDYLKIHVDLDELDLTKSESKATYAEIKSYVKDKTKGFMEKLAQAQEAAEEISRANGQEAKLKEKGWKMA